MSGKAGDDSGVISAGTNRKVQKRAAKGEKSAESKHIGFTPKRRKIFLSHFAATCNATASAAEAGVSPRTVYNWRRDDPEFRDAWEDALDQGYARLEAALVRSAAESLDWGADPPSPEVSAEVRVGPVDAKTALTVLEAYRRHIQGARTGGISIMPYDLEAVRARLEAKMRALGVIEDSAEAPPLPGQGGDPGVGARVCAPKELRLNRSTHPQPLPAREGSEK